MPSLVFKGSQEMYNLTCIHPFGVKQFVFSRPVHIIKTSWWIGCYPEKSRENNTPG